MRMLPRALQSAHGTKFLAMVKLGAYRKKDGGALGGRGGVAEFYLIIGARSGGRGACLNLSFIFSRVSLVV